MMKTWLTVIIKVNRNTMFYFIVKTGLRKFYIPISNANDSCTSTVKYKATAPAQKPQLFTNTNVAR